MAASNLRGKVAGQCIVDVIMNSRKYAGFRLGVLKRICVQMLYWAKIFRPDTDFQYGGPEVDFLVTGDLETCALSAASAGIPSLFDNLLPECKPIAVKSRRFKAEDK